MTYCILPAVKQNPTGACVSPEVAGSLTTTGQRAVEPLASLATGTVGVIVELQTAAETKTRLMELGVLAGTVVELVRFAPLGGPLEIKIRGYHLSLRKHEAEQILVRIQSN
jgi:ferrous iron transport protein A